jgi:hypothetical protein
MFANQETLRKNGWSPAWVLMLKRDRQIPSGAPDLVTSAQQICAALGPA